MRIFLPGILIIFLLKVSFVFGQNNGYTGDKKFYYGAAYYPEAWDLKEVDQDIVRMKELGMNVVRMGEFAWDLTNDRKKITLPARRGLNVLNGTTARFSDIELKPYEVKILRFDLEN
jgi:hypothetical protein